jgi:hypothetical protein
MFWQIGIRIDFMLIHVFSLLLVYVNILFVGNNKTACTLFYPNETFFTTTLKSNITTARKINADEKLK